MSRTTHCIPASGLGVRVGPRLFGRSGPPGLLGFAESGLPRFRKGELLGFSERFNKIFQDGGGGPIFGSGEGDKFGGTMSPDIGGSFSAIVDVQTLLHVGGDPGVEAAVCTAKEVNEPRFGLRWRRRIGLCGTHGVRERRGAGFQSVPQAARPAA